MKRGFDSLIVEISPSPSISDFKQLYIESTNLSTATTTTSITARRKKSASLLQNHRHPSTLIPSQDAQQLHEDISTIINQIINTNMGNIYENTGLKFVLFLGVQGKEYIDIITERFNSLTANSSSSQSHILFISYNLQQEDTVPDFPISTNNQCSSLVNHFKIKDPLGGGVYPLDYLYVIDKNFLIRCSIPIIINSNHRMINKNVNRHYSGLSSHLNFGIELEQLPGFVEEYITYFNQG
ncbi:uncharacterized protein RJT21DRAFT_121169 [Scheffersomyces amazonensis]|uniref:uncharacterized protein n=1 Tax=Scheffersomyces amazonensis TaxID=1078765 RepID=UPI00315D4D51